MNRSPHRGALVLSVVALSMQGTPAFGADEPVQVAQAVSAEAPALSPAQISLDFRQAEVQTVLQALARKAGINTFLRKYLKLEPPG